MDELIKKIPNATEKQKQVIKAWHESGLEHSFSDDKKFKHAVNDNVKTLESWETAKDLFQSDNFLFSTKALNRQETLYFVNEESGRLRQQHAKGPHAKIDDSLREHLFFKNKKDQKALQSWWALERASDKNEPKTKPKPQDFLKKAAELNAQSNPTKGWFHFEYEVENDVVTSVHASEGTVEMIGNEDENLPSQISTALQSILGVQPQ